MHEGVSHIIDSTPAWLTCACFERDFSTRLFFLLHIVYDFQAAGFIKWTFWIIPSCNVISESFPIFFCFFFFFSFFFQHCDLVGIEGRWTNEWMSSTLVCLKIYTLNTNLHLFQISFCSRAWFILLSSKKRSGNWKKMRASPKAGEQTCLLTRVGPRSSLCPWVFCFVAGVAVLGPLKCSHNQWMWTSTSLQGSSKLIYCPKLLNPGGFGHD